MKVTALAIAAALMLFAAPASAFHCPLDAKAIDNGLAKAAISAGAKAEAQKLRDEGMALHESGDHKGSVDKLSAAMRVILSDM